MIWAKYQPYRIFSYFCQQLSLIYQSQEMYQSIFKIGVLMLFAAFVSACSSKVLTKGSTSYDEDLGKTRVRYDFKQEDLLIKSTSTTTTEASKPATTRPTAAPSLASINKELDEIIKVINQQNRSVKYMPGYRIQIYVGNIRSEADAAKSFIYRQFPELTPYVTFSQPTYRVKAGDFMSKAEAEQVLASIRLQYSTAVIIADKIEIEKGLLQARAD